MQEVENFYYKNNHLFCGDYKLSDLTSLVQAPIYVHNADIISNKFDNYISSLGQLDYSAACYAKDYHIAVLSLFAQMGVSFICHNEGQIAKLIQSAGVDPSRLIFAGAYKTPENIAYAIKSGVGLIVIECIEELQLVNRVAASLGIKVPVLVRVRFDVDKVSSVRSVNVRNTNNFGIEWKELNDIYEYEESYSNIILKGISIKAASRSVVDVKSMQIIVKRLITIVELLKGKGHKIDIIDFTSNEYKAVYDERDQLKDFIDSIEKYLDDIGCRFIFGMSKGVTEKSGFAISKVTMIQDLPQRSYMVLDASFSDSLYKSDFAALPVISDSSRKKIRMNIICDVNGDQETILKKAMLSQGVVCEDIVVITNVNYTCMLVGAILSSSMAPSVIIVKNNEIIYNGVSHVDASSSDAGEKALSFALDEEVR